MNDILTYIDKNSSKIINLTKELVSIPTINPPGENYEKIAAVLEGYCKQLGLKTKKIIVPKEVLKKYGISKGSKRINLLAEWDVGAKETVHINGHYDVVPATGGWDTEPFRPVIKSSRLYGRGTEDMKGSIAAAVFALKAIKECGLEPVYNIQLSFTPDEETGGKTGFGYLAEKGFVKANFGIGEGYQNNFISYGNKGMVWFKVEVLGKPCHACEPYKGINSFEKMLVVADELMGLKRRIERRKTKFGTKDPRDKSPTMVMGGELWGGSKTNIVPDISAFTIDRRLLPEESIDEAKAEVTSAINSLKKRHKGLRVNIEVITQEPPVISKRRTGLLNNFSNSVKKVMKKKPKFAIMAGGTDMRFLMRKGVPCIGYSVDGGNTCHSNNEYVKIKSLIDTAKIYAIFLTTNQ